MALPIVYSIKAIEQQFNTGEEPVLVYCSDMNAYICKYMRSSLSAYKLACELIGSQMAKAWLLETPETAFVTIRAGHWSGRFVQHNLSAPALGCRRLEHVVDITPSTFSLVKQSDNVMRQLLKIALFDFWIANEDRNSNNANLLYDVVENRLVSIDYGCILNTATFEYPMSQLTSTDTILCSDLFQHIQDGISQQMIYKLVESLEDDYNKSYVRAGKQVDEILGCMPNGWHVPTSVIESKLSQLFDKGWTSAVWDNFMECFKENVR